MRIIDTVARLQSQSRLWCAEGARIGFVPTMGALHAGHLSLVEAALRQNDRVIVSVFVNPTQFNDQADLDAYPRDFEADAAVLAAAGVDVAFHPDVDEMYPAGTGASAVRAGDVAQGYEGAHRPGHFDGVTTVVARLFNAALADRAYFGRKDAQQLAVIRAMARDLGFPVEVVGCLTVRDQDGLALSSRNARLTPEERQAALALVQSLAAAQRDFASADRSAEVMAGRLRRHLDASPGVDVEYAAVVDPNTFEAPLVAGPEDLAIIAARVGPVRLIDNVALGARDVIQLAPSQPTTQSASKAPQGVMS
ncbi:MAG: pantoate--beta-alanine ligase [Candidatus Dormibacteraeota bacterium]|nr:pantoate--beta-alanine ligase [Candidatus Dormibacteraeota bacterium]